MTIDTWRVLATTVLSHISEASTKDCEYVAKALIQKLPFLQEYVSCAICLFVCEHCYSRIRGRKLFMYRVKTVIILLHLCILSPS